MKYWEILLTKQRERGKSGLTLPFLIGSQKYLPSTHIRQNIAELIHDMVSSNTLTTHIKICTNVQTLVFEASNYCHNYPTYNNRKQNGLSVAKGVEGDSIEALIKHMIYGFQSVIDKELFSAEPEVNAREATWRGFDYDDREFIESRFNTL